MDGINKSWPLGILESLCESRMGFIGAELFELHRSIQVTKIGSTSHQQSSMVWVLQISPLKKKSPPFTYKKVLLKITNVEGSQVGFYKAWGLSVAQSDSKQVCLGRKVGVTPPSSVQIIGLLPPSNLPPRG